MSELANIFRGMADHPSEIGKYYKWIIDSAKEVVVVGLDKLDFKYSDRVKNSFQMKACFANALIAAKKKPGAKYVLGYVIFHGIPLEHAWNKIGDVYFDPTSAALGRSVGDKYFSIIEITPSKADALGALHSAMSLLQIYYESEVAESGRFKTSKMSKSKKVTESILYLLSSTDKEESVWQT